MTKLDFETGSIDLTAYLMEIGIAPVGNRINGGNWISFLFPDSTELHKAISEYETGAAVAPAKSLLGQRGACYRIANEMLRSIRLIQSGIYKKKFISLPGVIASNTVGEL